MKKTIIIFAAVLCSFLLGGCGDANWDGTFYMEVDENNSIAFEITMDGDDYVSFTRHDINTYGGGTAVTSVTGGAELLNGNTAESSEFKLSLSGDTLKVKSLSSDEYYEGYEGKYTRGEPMPAESSDEADEDME